ncbi:hypothetical protein CAI21_20295 [Alkalilimnicola ehrlichii]|uniref:DM13 domain-containing protein n=1 Tax=Alkalilimnicola ehrlichii TaxID=351052 RepID=A0A3E0WHZ6_9GAMM|nr:hypothetical protein [Alkalilimnicola ehrlichii]RFA24812.1 hypothetical protein CAI21_20295 [Alkalilimnicola ehrlichii]RFA32069.1 hypothetical protein CAL65_20755 [Alkalilimnicola ehrlichii]
MRSVFFLLALAVAFPGAASAVDTGALERMVTCRADAAGPEAETLRERYLAASEPPDNPHFYRPSVPMDVFGAEVAYVGFRGYDMAFGPNVVVHGDIDELTLRIGEHLDLEPEVAEPYRVFDVSSARDYFVALYPHAGDDGDVVLQCVFVLSR